MKTYLKLAFPLAALTISSISFAQTSTTSTASTAAAPAATSTTATQSSKYDIVAPKIGPVTIKAAITSQNTTGRGYEYDNSLGRRYRLKNEYSVGAVHTSGFGLSAMAVTSGKQYAEGNTAQNRMGAGDPSLTLIHPALYKDQNLSITGQLRRYFPVSDFSVNRTQQQVAYYLFANYTLPKSAAVWNQLTGRNFDQSFYNKADSKYLVEDYTTLTQNLNSWFKYGIGQHTQFEWHETTAPGQSIELYPLADFIVSSNIYIEPRLYFPLLSVNTVYDAPKAVALNNTQAELFIRMGM